MAILIALFSVYLSLWRFTLLEGRRIAREENYRRTVSSPCPFVFEFHGHGTVDCPYVAHEACLWFFGRPITVGLWAERTDE
jgi:hypothetical protein